MATTNMNDLIRRRGGRQQQAEEQGDGNADPAVLLDGLLSLRDDRGAWDALPPAVRIALVTYEAAQAATPKE